MAHALGVDFGTSNTAAGYLCDGQPQLIELSPGQTTIPTTFFFDFQTRGTLIGDPANEALLNGIEGRFMRALKRVLGTTLMHETRQILSQRVTFVDIIGQFLRHIKTRAEAETGLVFERALSGRPVVFHGQNDLREAQAEADLRSCYLAAGFSEVDFMPEPEAAAIASGAQSQPGEIGLIVDIGGGTSDFSVFRSSGERVAILANHGVRIGGTDFDRSISIETVMPLLGRGTMLGKAMGAGLSPVPKAIFNDLATWEKIPFLYTGQNRRVVADMVRLAKEPTKLGRLATVMDDELGHELAFAVERGKIAANAGAGQSSIALGLIEKGLSVPLPRAMLSDILSTHAHALQMGVDEVLSRADIAATAIDRVIYVGGSSMMSMVSDVMTKRFPNARHSVSEVFTAVANGLAIAAAQR